ncbi:lipoyl(octanoyl) transferase [Sporothrix schenckii 1099-18]|uniref:BPL/LPL catalytic domain-containing protein n=2 Tax=Sporothrix schenckii TaxID=29908 RepID=U7PX16_SPOS1|nr:lipoyl(octanoyl) transferase [Sporothrix schenckii 1099-18]ERS99000.1 hypothetical protein HMPREF1624_04195 [Sporothrix schenckii ATCC 58251]KJR83353.1 lipoyl(octanoyl) transferase [Sporothrix schenckii 1099-18]
MRLRLIQLPPLPSYRLAAAVQELVRRQFLHAKESAGKRATSSSLSSAQSSSSSSSSILLSLLVQPPPPTVIAFTPLPTFTLGRRQSEAQLELAERDRLTAPLRVDMNADVDADGGHTYTPALISTLRGGLTTYHGPGQAVLWPVLDLKSTLFAAPLTVRAYSRLLETTTATVLKRRFGLEAYTTGDPGLWVASRRAARGGAEDADDTHTEERKVAALGVHLRRHISALGVAVNLDTPVTWAPSPSSVSADASSSTNPWTRFDPCGLSGKGVASVADEARLRFGSVPAAWDLRPAPFAAKWAAALAMQLGLRDPEVDVADAATVQSMLRDAQELLTRGVTDET